MGIHYFFFQFSVSQSIISPVCFFDYDSTLSCNLKQQIFFNCALTAHCMYAQRKHNGFETFYEAAINLEFE